jgi:hypothetical protein
MNRDYTTFVYGKEQLMITGNDKRFHGSVFVFCYNTGHLIVQESANKAKESNDSQIRLCFDRNNAVVGIRIRR